MTTVLIAGGGTGGHLMPALALAEGLKARHPDWRIVMVGAERGLEARLLPERDFPFTLLPAEPIHRHAWWRNLRWPFLAGRLLRRTGALLDREGPGLVVGTGGYASAPVVWLAARRGIPTAILEVDARPGLATRWLAGSAREIYLGAPEAEAAVGKRARGRVLVTGAPIRPPDPGARARGLARFALDSGRPVVLVAGGSQGALAINQVVAAALDAGGFEGLQLIWATGAAPLDRFKSRHDPPAVHVTGFLDPIADAFGVADLAVGRAGMSWLSELAAWGLPAVLIPLPTAAADHQSYNARAFVEGGAGVLLPQSGLTPSRLVETVRELLGDRDRLLAMGREARARGRPGATDQIVARLEALVGGV